MKINLQGVCNARDLGGISTPYGTVCRNRLIRSGALNEATAQDVVTLQNANLQRIIDLRTSAEMANSPDVTIPGVAVTNVSVLPATTFGISYNSLDGQTIATMLQAGMQRMANRNETPSEHMRLLYARFVNTEYCRHKYGEFLQILANRPTNGATLWHCSAGKDRVGTCTALLLHCLGANDKQIMDDYLATNEQSYASNVSIMAKIRPFVTDEMLQLVDKLLTVDESYLQTFWTEIASQYGNVDNFVAECGVTAQDVENLRKNYLE